MEIRTDRDPARSDGTLRGSRLVSLARGRYPLLPSEPVHTSLRAREPARARGGLRPTGIRSAIAAGLAPGAAARASNQLAHASRARGRDARLDRSAREQGSPRFRTWALAV